MPKKLVFLEDLRVCKSCGNVFSKRAGVTLIIECPQCRGTNFESITRDYDELSQE